MTSEHFWRHASLQYILIVLRKCVKCAIIDPNYVTKQYYLAINYVLAKLKDSFFRYSTTSTVTNSKKETNTTNNTPEEDQSKNTEMEGSCEKKMEDYSKVLTAKTRKQSINLLYNMYLTMSFFPLFSSLPPQFPVYALHALSYCMTVI